MTHSQEKEDSNNRNPNTLGHCPTAEILKAQIHAEKYAEMGFSVIPVPRGQKAPNLLGWPDLRLTETEIPKHFGKHPSNIGVLNGEASDGLVDADLDDPTALEIAVLLLPETEMKTGRASSPCSHWFYRVANPGDTKQFVAPPNLGGTIVEYRSNSTQTIMPPSVHPIGEVVEFFEDGEPATTTRETLLTALGKLASATLLSKVWKQGLRHKLALALSGTLYSAGWNEQETQEFIYAICIASQDEEAKDRSLCVSSTFENASTKRNQTGRPTLERLIGKDIVACVEDWLGAGQEILAQSTEMVIHSEQPNKPSDGEIKDHFVKKYGHNLRYNANRRCWYSWNGKHWEADDKQTAVALMEENIRDLQQSALSINDSGIKRELLKHLLNCDSYRRINELLSLSQHDLVIADGDFDTKTQLINFNNGTFDLKTGELRPFDRGDLLTRIIPIDYDPKASCPAFLKFIGEVCCGREELVEYLQRVFGYSLSGSQKEQSLFILCGDGQNGKSTLLNTMRRIFGPYAIQASMQTFVTRRNDQTYDLANLKGTRFVSVSESEQSYSLSESLIKQLTGGEPIRCRPIYKDEIEFTPQCQFFISTNYLPQVKGNDRGIWRRLNVAPFDFVAEKADQNLPDKLWAEREGILAWIVDGCLEWQKSGLSTPDIVRLASDNYRHESDVVGLFLAESCETVPNEKVSKGDLYTAFEIWCDENGYEKVGKRRFGETLNKRGFEEHREGQIRYWKNTKLKYEVFDQVA